MTTMANIVDIVNDILEYDTFDKCMEQKGDSERRLAVQEEMTRSPIRLPRNKYQRLRQASSGYPSSEPEEYDDIDEQDCLIAWKVIKKVERIQNWINDVNGHLGNYEISTDVPSIELFNHLVNSMRYQNFK